MRVKTRINKLSDLKKIKPIDITNPKKCPKKKRKRGCFVIRKYSFNANCARQTITQPSGIKATLGRAQIKKEAMIKPVIQRIIKTPQSFLMSSFNLLTCYAITPFTKLEFPLYLNNLQKMFHQ